jgi:Major intrinsic protein
MSDLTLEAAAVAADGVATLPAPAVPDIRPDLARRLLMEGIGTYALVVAGCGAVIANTVHAGSLGSVGVSLVFGLIIMAMTYTGGHLSGAHYNPAVTVAFAVGRHFPLREAGVYEVVRGGRPAGPPPLSPRGQPRDRAASSAAAGPSSRSTRTQSFQRPSSRPWHVCTPISLNPARRWAARLAALSVNTRLVSL